MDLPFLPVGCPDSAMVHYKSPTLAHWPTFLVDLDTPGMAWRRGEGNACIETAEDPHCR